MAAYESVLCVKNEVFVYRIPPRSSNRGYRAAEWKLDNPDWTGRMKIVALGQSVSIRLEDKSSGELFAKCPVDSYPSVAVEQVLDSSRYFVLMIKDESGRSAFIGLGFADRADSFDLLVALQDHFKWLKREEKQKQEEEKQKFDPGPKLDLGFKEGQTIRINLQTKKSEEGVNAAAKSRNRAGGNSTGLLPPPPGGVKIPGPPRGTTAPPSSQTFASPASAAAAAAIPATQTFSQPSAPSQGQSSVDLLLDLGASQSGAQPQTVAQPSDPWGDFTSSSGSSGSSNQSSNSAGSSTGWVSFE